MKASLERFRLSFSHKIFSLLRNNQFQNFVRTADKDLVSILY